MSERKLVTSNQTDSVLAMANAKGISREQFQKGLDNGRIARFLDTLKIDLTAVTPPQGARVYILKVKVKLDRPWQEAVDAAGLNTPDSSNVRKVSNLYIPTGTEEVEEELILLNYHEGCGNWDKTLAWAKDVGLKKTVPREVFAVGEQHPKLHEKLGVNPMYVIATTECIFADQRRACYVWWDDSDREANLDWPSFFSTSDDWFAFRK